MYYSATSQLIKGYPMYRIDEQGNITSSWRGKKLKHHDNAGYKMVFLKRNDKGRWQYVHRLLAIQYIPVPERLKGIYPLWVNHKDGNKGNNALDNLEWSTIAENIQHSFTVLKRTIIKGSDHWRYGKHLSDNTKQIMSEHKLGEKHPKFKGYYVFPDGRQFASALIAERETGIYAKKVWRYCKASTHGYSFIPS